MKSAIEDFFSEKMMYEERFFVKRDRIEHKELMLYYSVIGLLFGFIYFFKKSMDVVNDTLIFSFNTFLESLGVAVLISIIVMIIIVIFDYFISDRYIDIPTRYYNKKKK